MMISNSILPVDGQLDKEDFTELDEEIEVCYKLFSSNPNKVVKLPNVKFFKCKFIHIDFTNIDINETQFDCCIFENCSLANYDLSKFGLTNCIFEKCKLVGMVINNSTIKNVTFDNCEGSYNDFSISKLINVHFIDSKFFKTNFYKIDSKDLIFSHADISGSEFFESNLKEVDISSTTINDITIDLRSLKGVIVSKNQALTLASILGIYIKEDLINK